MNHGIVDVFAFQEALLIEAVFGIALLTMIWVGFRRWLQYKDSTARLIAEQAARHGADMERVEARLKAIEQAVSDRTAEPINALPNPRPERALKDDQA